MIPTLTTFCFVVTTQQFPVDTNQSWRSSCYCANYVKPESIKLIYDPLMLLQRRLVTVSEPGVVTSDQITDPRHCGNTIRAS